MASKTLLLLALCFAVVLLITSEVAAAEDIASHHDSEVDGSGGYNRGVRGGQGVYNGGRHEAHGKGDGRVVYGGSGGGRGRSCGGGCGGRYAGGGRCRFGCCSKSKSCKCCSSFEEASAYKQTQN